MRSPDCNVVLHAHHCEWTCTCVHLLGRALCGSAADLLYCLATGQLHPRFRSKTSTHLYSSAVGVQVTNKLLLACSLSFAFMVVEVVGGFYAGRCAFHRLL